MISPAVAIDLGGTFLRAALLTSEGKILKQVKQVVGNPRPWEKVFEKICEAVREVAGPSLKDVAGIGAGFPGICDPQAGIVYQLPHYPEWRDVTARSQLAAALGIAVVIDNDANMAALGERWLGAGSELDSFILLTLGTGIGGAIFMDGKLWRGESGFAGELGHMVIEAEGRLCACGKRGCWEMYAGSPALAKEGDKKWVEFGKYLGLGISNLTNIFDVNHFILSGGIANSYENFIAPCYEAAKSRIYERKGGALTILPAKLGEEANLYGCAYSVRCLAPNAMC